MAVLDRVPGIPQTERSLHPGGLNARIALVQRRHRHHPVPDFRECGREFVRNVGQASGLGIWGNFRAYDNNVKALGLREDFLGDDYFGRD